MDGVELGETSLIGNGINGIGSVASGVVLTTDPASNANNGLGAPTSRPTLQSRKTGLAVLTLNLKGAPLCDPGRFFA